jgi:hypothetical protein
MSRSNRHESAGVFLIIEAHYFHKSNNLQPIKTIDLFCVLRLT